MRENASGMFEKTATRQRDCKCMARPARKPLRARAVNHCKGGGNAMTTETDTLDRQITMTCTPMLIWYDDGSIGATVTFTQTGGVPAAMNGRVDSHGAIDLTNMPTDDAYNDNIDVTINLDTSQMFDRDHQNAVAGRWATAEEYSGEGPVTGFCWFCGTDANGNYSSAVPILIPGMVTERLNDTAVLINDDTPDAGPAYAYCLGLVLPNNNGYYITIDPRITSKTSVGIGFMLNEEPPC